MNELPDCPCCRCVSYSDAYEAWTLVIIDDMPILERAVSDQSVCDYQFSILNRDADRDNDVSHEEALTWDFSAETFARFDMDSDVMITRDESLVCWTPQ